MYDMHKLLHLMGVWITRVLVVALVLMVGLIILALVTSQRKNVPFDRLAGMKYEDAIAEIRKNSHGSAGNPVLDGRRSWTYCMSLSPGKGSGENPRFVNIGSSPMTIYTTGGNQFYILGKAQVYDYMGGQWKANCVVENQRFEYHPK